MAGTAAAADAETIAAACAELEPSRGHGELLDRVSRLVGGRARMSLVGDAWRSDAALVAADGSKVAEDAESWILDACGGDLIDLYTRFADSGHQVTATTGRTLYMTVPTGWGALDFVQVEVDEVREVADRTLFEDDVIPDSVEELLAPARLTRPLTPRRYRLRGVTDFRAIAERLTGEHRGDPRFKRFVEEWAASSAGCVGRFCDRWVLSVVPYRDADGEHLLEARPIPVVRPKIPDLARLRTGAADYHPSRAVLAMDREAGYPMAWYFLQIAEHFAPYRCIVDIRDDFRDPPVGVAPLAPADLCLVDNWVEVPYTFH